jgi:hypothetical protein
MVTVTPNSATPSQTADGTSIQGATTPAAEPVTNPTIVDASDFGGSAPDIDAAVDDLINMLDDSGEEEPVVEATPAPVVAPPAAQPTPAQVVPPAQVVTPPATATPAVPAAPVPDGTPTVVSPTPAVAVPTGQEPAVAPAAAPVAQPATTPQQPTPAASPSDVFGSLQQQVQAQRAQIEPLLANLYTPNEAEMEEFHTAPEKVIGKALAKLHMEVVQNTLATLAQHQPAAVAGIMKAQEKHKELENQFWTQWPQLDRNNPAHQQVVMQTGAGYVRANPNADGATRMKHIGAAAIVALNLLPAAAPPVGGQTPVVAQPFAPAAAGQATPPPGGPELNGWAAVDSMLAQDEY